MRFHPSHFAFAYARANPTEGLPTDVLMATVVVVGGGPAGANVVRGLAAKLDPLQHKLVLITSRPQYVNLLGALRLMVTKDTPLDTVFMPYDNIFGSFPGELKIATVSSVEERQIGHGGTVNLYDGESIPYDVLILATGSVREGLVSFPNDTKAYHDHVANWRKKFEDAQDVVIVGGGPVGIETAGEIKDVYPTKKVTIVQGDRLLLNDVYPDKFRLDIERRLRRVGVNIILNDVIKGNPSLDTPLKTREGKVLTCDLLVTARGGGANTSYMKFLRPSPLTDWGYIKVLPTLEVLYHPGMFALGDVVDWPEVKQFAKIDMGHAAIVVANVLSYLSGEHTIRSYTGTREIMAISIGKHGGGSYLAFMCGIMFGNTITKFVKSRDLLVGQVRRSLGIA